jgi:hypothetical protein
MDFAAILVTVGRWSIITSSPNDEITRLKKHCPPAKGPALSSWERPARRAGEGCLSRRPLSTLPVYRVSTLRVHRGSPASFDSRDEVKRRAGLTLAVEPSAARHFKVCNRLHKVSTVNSGPGLPAALAAQWGDFCKFRANGTTPEQLL